MPMKAICAMLSICVCYGIYMSTTPGDGVLFGTMMLLLGALGGVAAAKEMVTRDRLRV